MVLNVEILENNGIRFLKLYSEAKKILKKADGKKNYKRIAKELKINEKIVSPILKQAKDLGFAERIKPGIYKKITSNLKYIPNKKREKVVDQDLIKKKMVGKDFSFKKEGHLETKNLQKFKDKSEKMARAYMWLYLTENALRSLIRNVLQKEDNWWEKRVNTAIKENVEESKLKEKYFSPKRDDNLEYTHLGQLKEIIVSRRNWSLFLPYLKEKEIKDFESSFKKVMPSRHAIAHCIPLKEKDYKAVEIRFGDVLDMIK